MKKGLRNFSRADDIENEGNSLEEKVRIINEWFAVGDEDDPSTNLTAEEIIEAIDNLMMSREPHARSYLNERDGYLKPACEQIVAVLSYLLGETTERPKSLAVYEPAEMVASMINMRDYAPARAKERSHKVKRETFWRAIEDCIYNRVEELIEEGADCSEKDTRGINALHYATRNGTSDIVELILQQGVDIEEETNFGMTPLMIAVDANDWDTVDVLLDAGADINHETENYGMALDVARSNDNDELAEHLIERGAWD